jgi:ABC-type iron transport system FetAB ATPase subunit
VDITCGNVWGKVPCTVEFTRIFCVFEVVNLSRSGLPLISFQLKPGEVVCLRGPSGCGKTQLLRSLIDLDCNQGQVRLQGEDRARIPPTQWRKRVALLPAESRWWSATVAEHFPSEPIDSLAELGFDAGTAGWLVDRLSSGEKQRLALLRLLANRPEVLLLDEPTANLDADNISRVESLVRHYLDDAEACCLWVSHDRSQCDRIATRILDMDSNGLQVSE